MALSALLWLSGCTLATGVAPGAEDPRSVLEARLVEAQESQAAALTLWDRVIFGELVACHEAIPVPAPVALTATVRAAYPDTAAAADALNEALRALQASSDLWTIECADPRDAVPLSMAREGRANALAAEAPLDEAAALLASWTPP